jgi:hypothetical protein
MIGASVSRGELMSTSKPALPSLAITVFISIAASECVHVSVSKELDVGSEEYLKNSA